MSEKNELKSAACAYIDGIGDMIGQTADEFLRVPELGFREFKSGKMIERRLAALCGSRNVTAGIALTGVVASHRFGGGGINVALISELDAVVSPEHHSADETTGAAHACGHHIQTAAALGAMEALIRSGISERLSGQITYVAAPAEEFVELEYRKNLKRQGKIGFLSGKQEMIRLGAFDGVDAAVMIHAHNDETAGAYFVGGGSLGFVAKTIEFIGKEAHAGACPNEGINALNAAMAALMCIHANRETFRDEDKIRIHPIITKGGDLVNIVPARVSMETFVRGANSAAITDAAAKVDRSVKGACVALGAAAKIEDIRGYMPLSQDEALTELFAENAKRLGETQRVERGVDMTGSSDIGDVSALLPTIQPTVGGFIGSPHTPRFECVNPGLVSREAAKIMAATVIDLLYGNAEEGIRIKKNFSPKLSKDEYIRLFDDNA